MFQKLKNYDHQINHFKNGLVEESVCFSCLKRPEVRLQVVLYFFVWKQVQSLVLTSTSVMLPTLISKLL